METALYTELLSWLIMHTTGVVGGGQLSQGLSCHGKLLRACGISRSKEYACKRWQTS